MEPNSIYYAFSAIPQVLAGAIALFGVFILFKVEEINKQLIGFGKSLLIEFDRDIKTKSLAREKAKSEGKMNSEPSLEDKVNKGFDYLLLRSRLEKAIDRFDLSEEDGVKKHIDHFIKVLKEGKEQEMESLESLSINYGKKEKHKNSLINWTIFTIGFSVFIIIGSIVILPFTKSIIQSKILSTWIFIIGIILFSLNLIILVYVIYKTFKPKIL